jgi:hypothetical protein
MSASEPYDFLTTIVADYDYTLTIKPQGKVREPGFKNQISRLADDNSEEIITLSGSMFYRYFSWNQLSEADAGTIFDLYHDDAKAKGMARSFKFSGDDGHIYVVKFTMPKLERIGNAVSRWGYPDISMRLIGRIADA